MKTETLPCSGPLKIVSPPEWELPGCRLGNLFLDYHSATGWPLLDEDERADWIADMLRDMTSTSEGSQWFFLVDCENDVRGWIAAEMRKIAAHYKSPQVPFIYNLSVLPEWRLRGYGKFLLTRGENYFRSRGETEVFLSCEPALRALYLAAGYAPFDLPTEERSGFVEEDLEIFRKRLG